jgi:hypothetical protein
MSCDLKKSASREVSGDRTGRLQGFDHSADAGEHQSELSKTYGDVLKIDVTLLNFA